jgi:hypothetical protein
MKSKLHQKNAYVPFAVLSIVFLWSLTACAFSQVLVNNIETPPPQTIPPLIEATQTPQSQADSTAIPFVPSSTPTPSTFERLPRPKLGVETHWLSVEGIMDSIQQSGANLVRHNALLWSQVESKEGELNWQAVSNLEAGLASASEHGIEAILIVRSTPPWAQKVEGYYCAAVKADKLQAFADFMGDAVARYSAPPFNVKYWELGNEPDVQPSFVPPESAFGCWGDEKDEYYGGGYYGEMLKRVYPAIKAADPQAQVLIGGLLLDCDPTQPPEGKDCKPAKFLEGILKNGGGDYFDIVSFHGYPQYYLSGADPSGLYGDEHFPSWEHRGGVVLGKADFIRSVLASYNLEKPLIHTEGSLTCPESNPDSCNPPSEALFEAQADYVVWMYIRNWAAGMAGTVWYQFEGPGWRYGAMLDENQQPKPAYKAFHFLTQETSDMFYTARVNLGGNLRGYELSGPEKRIWVAWSADGQAYDVTLPANWSVLYDKYGDQITPRGDEILSVQSPIYIEIAP